MNQSRAAAALDSKKPAINPRRRKIRRTAGLLAFLAMLGIIAGAWIYLKSRPEQYRPGEASEDVTNELARGLPPDAPKPVFADVTKLAGLASFRNFLGERTSQLPEDMGPGVAWGDFNNDGFEDVFLVSAGGSLAVKKEDLLPCELYQNTGSGSFRQVAAFPETRIRGMSAAWGDYDSDGYLDLVVTGYNALLLFHNERGTGKFTRDSRIPDLPGFWAEASWGDFNNDRAPDLYVCGYVQFQEHIKAPAPNVSKGAVPFTLNPASFLGGTNLLFANNRDGTFTESAARLRVQNPEGRSLAALWHDFDNDGWLDLYVANDISDNVMYRNKGGEFEDISHAAYVADYRSAMGLAVGDFDRDGDDDMFVTHWVAQENALYQNFWADHNLSNTNSGKVSRPLAFMDIADMKGLGQIGLPYVGWGTEFADFDSDGWLDLVVANGNTLEFDGPMPRKLKPQEAFLFWNARGEHFYNLAPLNASLSSQHNSRGLGLADFDNDGKLDILIADLHSGVRLLRNQMAGGNWLKLRLRSRTAAGEPLGFGDGSSVIARVGDAVLRRSVTSVSYLSQSSRVLHFGLGKESQAASLEVRWLAGATNVFQNLEANATYEIVEGEDTPRLIPSASSPAHDHAQLAPRERQLQFWKLQREGMDAMKVERNNAKAIDLFRQALALDPAHEDSLYYLALCLAATGDSVAALDEFGKLRRVNPSSHRAWQQSGVLQAIFAKSNADLRAAEEFLEKAHALNPEETGALLALGEVLLMQGRFTDADQRLTAACGTNPRAVTGLFLRAYLAWKNGENAKSVSLLEQTRKALGPDWQPKGSTAEGDVKQKQHVDSSPLFRFAQNWDGKMEPSPVFAALDQYLATLFR